MHFAPLAAVLARLGPALALVALVACQAQPAPAPAAPAKPAAAPAAPAAPPAPAAGAPAAAPAPTAVARLSPPVDVKIGLVNITGDAGTYIALERGYFEEEGLQVEIVSFPNSQEQIPALATNQLQFGTGSLDVSLLNAVARGVDLRIVNDRGRYDPSYTGSGIAVRSELYADGTLDEVAKLKGKTMGISVLGTTTDLYLELMLGRAGLTLDDVTFTVMPMPNMAPALSNGAVESAWLFEPFVAQITSAGIGKMLTATGQVAPQHYGGFLLVAEQFAQQNPEAVRRFVTAFMRGQRDYYRAFILRETSDADRESIINLWIKYTAVKDRSMYDKLTYVTIEPNGFVDPAVLEEFQEWAFQRGRLPQKVDVRRLVDPQYSQYAVERLGRLPERYR